jgi:hypothetical protein
MAALTITIFCFPQAWRVAQNAFTMGFQRIAEIAGKESALRTVALPFLDRRARPRIEDPEVRCCGVRDCSESGSRWSKACEIIVMA